MPLAVIRTNLDAKSLPKNLMSKFSDFLIKSLECDERVAMVEVHTGIMMMRAGTTEAMLNIELHHNDDKIHEDTKRDYATKIAQFLVEHVKVKMERILVLFFDARRCTTTYLDTHL